MAKSGIPGRKIVPVLYGVAVLMCGALLWYGLTRGKDSRPEGAPLPERLTVALEALETLPDEWTRITFIEGQGWVRFEPCFSEVGTLRIHPVPYPPRLECFGCDTITAATIHKARLRGSPPRIEMTTKPEGHAITVESVDALVAMRFGNAPMRDYVLTWRLSREAAMYFVPSFVADDFELLRAEDESPEGCLGNGEEHEGSYEL